VPALETIQVNLPYIDRIWRVRDELALDPPQSAAEVFGKLDPLFQSTLTTKRVDGDTLNYSNSNPAAQDKLATFNKGTLRVVGGSKLSYDLTSPALLACFLAPLLFLGFALLTIGIGQYEKSAEAHMTVAEKKAAGAKKKKQEAEDAKPPKPLNPIDAFLGAPAPESPKKKAEETKKKEKEKKEDEDKGPSPKPAYVFAGMFAFLYVVGRILEPWLIKRQFRLHLFGAPNPGRERKLGHWRPAFVRRRTAKQQGGE
jgi:GH24 family phage-related lysozyme (muramidase)